MPERFTFNSLEREEEEGTKVDSKFPDKHVTPQFLDLKANTLKLRNIVASNEQLRRNKEDSTITQSHATVEIKTDKPVSIVHMGDTHVGSVFTELKEVLRKFMKIDQTPNTYTILMGNMVDNAIPAQFPDGMLTSTMEPEEQVGFMRKIFRKLNEHGKIIAAVASPCHEGWSYKKAGQDVNNLLYDFEGRNFPVFENGGELDIKVGDQEYKAGLYHQSGPFNSNFNPNHATRQMHRLNLLMSKDWVAAAHNHVGDVEETYEGTGDTRKKVVYVRTGSEKGTGKLHDKFIQDRSGKTGQPTGQTIHLFPGAKQILGNLDFDEGIDAHKEYMKRK